MSMQDHVTHLEMLREEINLITRRKLELEKKVAALIDERETLTTTLDETADKIVMLERHTREQECRVIRLTFVALLNCLSGHTQGNNKIYER